MNECTRKGRGEDPLLLSNLFNCEKVSAVNANGIDKRVQPVDSHCAQLIPRTTVREKDADAVISIVVKLTARR